MLKINKQAILLLKIIFSAGIIWFLIHTSLLQFNLFKKIFQNYLLLFSSILIFLLMVLLNAWRWYQLNIAQKIKFNFKKTAIAIYLSTGFNSILPGTLGGDVLRVVYLFKKNPQKKSNILLSVLFDRVIGLMGLFIVICFIFLTHLNLFRQHDSLYYLFLSCVTIGATGLIIFFISLYFPKIIFFRHWLEKVAIKKSWANAILSFLDAIEIYQKSKLTIVHCLVTSIIIQCSMVCVTLIIAKMMGFPALNPIDYAIAIGITQIVNLIPAAPGGLGIGEVAFANILLLLNPTRSAAYATIFIAYRLIALLTYLPGIFISLLSYQHAHKKT